MASPELLKEAFLESYAHLPKYQGQQLWRHSISVLPNQIYLRGPEWKKYLPMHLFSHGKICPDVRLWNLNEVQDWLEYHQFSRAWRQAFRILQLDGEYFWELGYGWLHRRKNGTFTTPSYELLSNDVYQLLAKCCLDCGDDWNQEEEKAECRRLRRLVRQIVPMEPSMKYDEPPLIFPRLSEVAEHRQKPSPFGKKFSCSFPSCAVNCDSFKELEIHHKYCHLSDSVVHPIYPDVPPVALNQLERYVMRLFITHIHINKPPVMLSLNAN